MRTRRLFLLLALLCLLVACTNRRGGGGGGGGSDDDDSGVDDDDVSDDDDVFDDDDGASPGGTLAISSAPISTTLPALVARVRNQHGLSIVVLGGMDDCGDYRRYVAAVQEDQDLYLAGDIDYDEYTERAMTQTLALYDPADWIVSILLSTDSEWETGPFEPMNTLLGKVGTAWDSTLGVVEVGFSTPSGFSGTIHTAFPEFEATLTGEASWTGEEFDGSTVSVYFEATASLCDIDLTE